MNETTALVPLSGKWQDAAGAWLAEVARRTGSERTPQEYARLLARFLFLAGIEDPAQATPAHVEAFAYAPGPSGKTPSASTTNVRLAAVSRTARSRGLSRWARRNSSGSILALAAMMSTCDSRA